MKLSNQERGERTMSDATLPIRIATNPKFRSLLPLADKAYSWVTLENSRQLMGEPGNEHSLKKIEEMCNAFMDEMARLELEPSRDWRECYSEVIRPLQILRVRRGH
jgi:hypothetical protein